MNCSTTICPVQVFKDSFWLPVASAISYGIGVLVAGLWIVEIWRDLTNPQKFWTVFSILKAWNKILVSKLCNNCNETNIFNEIIFRWVLGCFLLLDYSCYKYG